MHEFSPCKQSAGLGLAWLAKPKGHSSHIKNHTLPKNLWRKTNISAKYCLPLRYKKRPIKITIYLGLDIIIQFKFTTNFDRHAILNVLNCLSKNFEF